MTEFAGEAPSDRRPRERRPASTSRRRAAHGLAGAVALFSAAVLVAACSSTSGTPTPASASTLPSGAAGNGGAGAGQGSRSGFGQGQATPPGASGTIAAVSAGSFELQSTTSQTTVNYTSSTHIQQTVAGSFADVAAGACITAIAAPSASGSPSTAQSSAAAAGRSAPRAFATPSHITAISVTVEPATNGSCTVAGLGGFTGDRGGAAGASRTSGGRARPTGTPTGSNEAGNGAGNRTGFAGFGGVVAGQVTSVSGSTITVTVRRFAGRAGQGGAGATATTATPAAPSTAAPSTTTSTATVTVTGATHYAKTTTAESSAIRVGLCASAFGTADDTGAIAATQIRLTDPVSGGCSTAGLGGGFGGFNRGSGNSGGGNSGGGQGTPVTSNG